MPIDAREKSWFDAIDGDSRISEIVEKKLPAAPEKSWLDLARSFFERLWWYDQVVFDASPPNGAPTAATG